MADVSSAHDVEKKEVHEKDDSGETKNLCAAERDSDRAAGRYADATLEDAVRALRTDIRPLQRRLLPLLTARNAYVIARWCGHYPFGRNHAYEKIRFRR